jgi:TldD protein
MSFLLPEDPTRLAVHARDATGAGWAELFHERRCVVRTRSAGEGGSGTTEAWDLGTGARVVLRDGRILHASSTGRPDEASARAVSRLIERAGGGAGAIAQPRPASPESGPAGGDPDGRQLEERVAKQADLLGPLLERLSSWLGRLPTRSCRGEIDASISVQQVDHASTDSAPARDTRTGVLIAVRLSGPAATIHRRWAAVDGEALLSGRDIVAEVAAMEEALGLIAAAAPAPEGEFPVVFAAGTGGVLLHEAVGHLLEGDLVAGLGSRLSRLRAEGGRQAPSQPPLSPLLTVVDDPLGMRGRGSFRMDDEGRPARRSVLVDRGRIVGSVGDRWNSSEANAHARRQSHRDPPLPRLASTYCLPGGEDPEEIVRNTTRGIYVDQVRAGSVDPASGEFILHAAEGRLIEGGRLTAGVRDLLIIGEAVRSLARVDRLGHDLAGDGGAYSCVRSGQAVPTIVGMPTLRIAKLKVSGMADE